jgi:hypothetical protein
MIYIDLEINIRLNWLDFLYNTLVPTKAYIILMYVYFTLFGPYMFQLFPSPAVHNQVAWNSQQ